MTRLTNKYEPHFDVDYEYGRQGELFVYDVIEALKHDRVEIKRKRREDDLFYVEYECLRQGVWTPSGIGNNETELFAFVIGETGVAVVVTKERLLAATRYVYRTNKKARKTEEDGSHPTKGVLVPFRTLINRKAA